MQHVDEQFRFSASDLVGHYDWHHLTALDAAADAPAFFADEEMYLLRNLSKGHGVGFEAGNFHPDFILGRQ
jgi:hypothetical protein